MRRQRWVAGRSPSCLFTLLHSLSDLADAAHTFRQVRALNAACVTVQGGFFSARHGPGCPAFLLSGLRTPACQGRQGLRLPAALCRGTARLKMLCAGPAFFVSPSPQSSGPLCVVGIQDPHAQRPRSGARPAAAAAAAHACDRARARHAGTHSRGASRRMHPASRVNTS